MTLSPTWRVPESMVPVTMRRSSPCLVNLYTSCTAMRNGWSTGVGSVWNWSSASSTVGPSYHGAWAERSAMLSPPRPDAGMNAAGRMPTCSRNAPYSRTMPSYTPRSQPTRSILFTTTASCLMPRSETM